ncbi:MAG: FAS1-like dehydratase domain-containing protein, partial [Alphaproteobacteria bacterium]
MTDNAEQESFPVITDEMIADMRARIGNPLTDKFEPWVTEVNRDAIRHYAHGIGDDNPLWCDPDYAKGTKFKDIIAPPTIPFACTQAGGSVTGMPGIHAMWAGCEFTWHHPIRRNTAIQNKAYLKDLIEHQTRFAGRAFQQIHHIDFFDEKGVLLVELDNWMFRTERDAARDKGTKYDKLKKTGRRKLTDADLKRVHDLYEAEEIRGATPRYWEDVAEGETLPTMAKGPMTVTGFIAYVQGWGGLYIRSNKLYYKQAKRLPALAIKDEWGIPDCPEAVHWR